MVHIDNGYSYNEHALTCDTTNPIYVVFCCGMAANRSEVCISKVSIRASLFTLRHENSASDT